MLGHSLKRWKRRDERAGAGSCILLELERVLGHSLKHGAHGHLLGSVGLLEQRARRAKPLLRGAPQLCGSRADDLLDLLQLRLDCLVLLRILDFNLLRFVGDNHFLQVNRCLRDVGKLDRRAHGVLAEHV